MSELFLVRHAQASFGSDNYDRLSELGHRQARWLGEHFRERALRFDRIVCGAMVRQRETVAGILAGMGETPLEPECDDSWDEFDFEAIVTAFLARHPERQPSEHDAPRSFSRLLRDSLQAWIDDRLEADLPERWLAFDQRVQRGLDALGSAGNDRQRVLVVSSGGAISAALGKVLQAPPSTMLHLNLQLRNSGVNHLYFNDRAFHLAGFNHTPHLDRPDRAAAVSYY